MVAPSGVEEIAQPAHRLPFVNSPSLYLADRRLLAAVTYSGTGRDAALFLVDVDSGQDRKFNLPEGNRGAYGFVRGADGRLYLGTFLGKIYRFDLDQPGFEEAAHPFTAGEFIWGGGSASWGKVYMGVCPTGEVCEYDVAGGGWAVLSPMPKAAVAFYATGFRELPDGTLLIFVAGAQPTFFIFDPRGRRFERVAELDPEENAFGSIACNLDDDRLLIQLPHRIGVLNWRRRRLEDDFLVLPEESLRGIIRVGGDILGLGFPSQRIYRLTGGRMETLREPVGPAAPGDCLHHLGGDEFVTISDNGLFQRLNLATGEMRTRQASNESRTGMGIQFLKKIPGRQTAVGAHFINMQVFTVDVAGRRSVSSLGKISHFGGQVNCACCLDGVVYLASYGRAVLYAFDPDRPFEFGTNPRVLGCLGEEQNRPVAAVTDGRRVYVATKAGYGKLGGAIGVYDPATGKIATVRHVVPDQNLNSLFYHAASKCLVGTSETYGDCRTRAARAESAVVFVWDPATRRTTFAASPWPADQLVAAALSDAGEVVGFGPDRYFIFDVAARTFAVHPFALGPVSGGTFLADGQFYGVTDRELFALDVAAATTRILGPANGIHHLERWSDTELLGDADGTRVVKIDVARLAETPPAQGKDQT